MRKRNAASRNFVWLIGLCVCSGLLHAADVAKLAEELRAPMLSVRRDAAYQLNQLGKEAKDAVPALIKALEDSDHQVWVLSISALAHIGPDATAGIPTFTEGMQRRW